MYFRFLARQKLNYVKNQISFAAGRNYNTDIKCQGCHKKN